MPKARLKVMCIFGTRPEVIKMAPVVQELQRHQDSFLTLTCATAQHRQMLDQALDIWRIVPDIDLNVMEEVQTPTQVATRVMTRLEPVLAHERPDWILVQGDTTTVMAAAIAAHHLRVKVGHVEAGLRTLDKWNPFPEEMNRVVTDHLSDLCFAPTARARTALLREGIDDGSIRVTGNTVVDALLDVARRGWSPPFNNALCRLPADRRLILVTAHRRESFGEPLNNIFRALLCLAQRSDILIVYPVHPNPNVYETAHAVLGGHPNITLLAPVNYQELVYLMKRCALVLTDSGGLQEEAPSLGKPVLVLRDNTERPEAIEAGVARIAGTETERIVALTAELLDKPGTYQAMAHGINPYGDGHAAEQIVKTLGQMA
jgi:UDP-N-acetylglucosamine 2-epimerase (non-hydrolysing)